MEDLPAVYGATAADNGPTFPYTPDEVVIVGLIDDWCYVSMLDADDWSDLWDIEDETDTTALAEVVLAGLPASAPRAAIVPRPVGLAAMAAAICRVRSSATWTAAAAAGRRRSSSRAVASASAVAWASSARASASRRRARARAACAWSTLAGNRPICCSAASMRGGPARRGASSPSAPLAGRLPGWSLQVSARGRTLLVEPGQGP
ncbi:hypothetical protein GCM10020218_067680 [Dactylosporangium vinaceum]